MTRPLCLLTHPDGVRERYFGARALAALRDVAEVRLNARERPMTAPELIEAARDADVIVSDRATPGEAGLFAALPGLRAFVRVAVDIRTVDVEAASHHGVLVTRTSAGFVPAVLNTKILDGVIQVTHEDAFKYAVRCVREEGIFIGISSGASLAAIAKKLPEIPDGSRILTFCYDTGERYLSVGGLFD